MARTELTIPTSLSGDELAARLEAFFRYHQFKKSHYWGEELYKISSWLWQPGYIKIVPENGIVFVEAFTFKRYGSEVSLDDIFVDHYDLRGKLRSLSKIIGSGSSMDNAPATADQQQNNQPYTSDQGFHEFDEQLNPKRRNPLLTGCLIGCLIFFALPICVFIAAFLYGIFLALFFPDTLKTDADSPEANNVVVIAPEWKTLQEDRYSFQYPGDWALRSTEEKPKKVTTRRHYGKGRIIGYTIDYMFPPKEPEIPKTTVPPILQQFQYVLGCKSSEGDGYAVHSFIASRENSGLYDALTEDAKDPLLAEHYPSFACDTFEKGEVNGKRTLFAVYSSEIGEKKKKLYFYLYENGDTILTIWFVVEDADDEKYQPIFEKIISTLQLK